MISFFREVRIIKFLTKEWYEKCQLTGLHFGLRVHPGADSANIYDRLYKRKEQAFIKFEREVYDCRPLFDIESCKQSFHERIEFQILHMKGRLPSEILNRISDIRLFALGYCTSEIYADIKKFCIENKKHTKRMMEELHKVRRLQAIPESINNKFNFHDCEVLHLEQSKEKNYIIQLDPSGGFTEYNKVTFVHAEVIRNEPNIVGASWIYDEIYSTSKGYEVHILFHGASLSELIVDCEDIVIEQVQVDKTDSRKTPQEYPT